LAGLNLMLQPELSDETHQARNLVSFRPVFVPDSSPLSCVAGNGRKVGNTSAETKFCRRGR
jgi:hypothetical protein